MSDELDNMTDAKLSEIFVRDCLGREVNDGMMRMADTSMGGLGFESWRAIPSFATSADAVLPFLENENEFPEITRPCVSENYNANRVWQVQLDSGHAIAPTFARAACIALIRAKRAVKEDAA